MRLDTWGSVGLRTQTLRGARWRSPWPFSPVASMTFRSPRRATRNIDTRLIGDWSSDDGQEKLAVRELTGTTYLLLLNGDPFRAYHSDFAGVAFVTVQDLDGRDRKYAYLKYALSPDGQRLTAWAVNTDTIPKTRPQLEPGAPSLATEPRESEALRRRAARARQAPVARRRKRPTGLSTAPSTASSTSSTWPGTLTPRHSRTSFPSGPIRNVDALDAADLLAVHVLHLDHVELLAQLFVGIGDQLERKSHLRLEALVRLERVARARRRRRRRPWRTPCAGRGTCAPSVVQPGVLSFG